MHICIIGNVFIEKFPNPNQFDQKLRLSTWKIPLLKIY